MALACSQVTAETYLHMVPQRQSGTCVPLGSLSVRAAVEFGALDPSLWRSEAEYQATIEAEIENAMLELCNYTGAFVSNITFEYVLPPRCRQR